jgi:hypothetical protein
VQGGKGRAFVRMPIADRSNTLLQQEADLAKGGAAPLSLYCYTP